MDIKTDDMQVTCGRTEDGAIVVGGCEKVLSFSVAFRCTHCLVWFHRSCANEHFKLDAYVKRLRELNEQGAIEDWKKEVAKAKAEAARVEADTAARCVAFIRFEKYQNRGEGVVDSDPHSDDNPDYIRAEIDDALEAAVSRITAAFPASQSYEARCAEMIDAVETAIESERRRIEEAVKALEPRWYGDDDETVDVEVVQLSDVLRVIRKEE